MSEFTSVVLFTGVLFLALIINLAIKKEYSTKVTGRCIVIAALGGVFIYGYGYSVMYADKIPLAVLRSLIAVFGIFTGKNDFSVVKDTPLFAGSGAVFFFWLIHFVAQYATASAVIATIGARALHRMRLWLACFGKLSLIYGVNENSISFGRRLAAGGDNVVFVDEKPADSLKNAASAFGAVIVSDKHAITPDRRFVRNMGIRPGRKHYDFYALHTDCSKNIRFAFALSDALSAADIDARQTGIVLLGEEETHTAQLQAYGDRYGFGNVTVFEPADMAARLLIQKFPPAATISFDENGLAAQDFSAAIIGFGRVGQAVLKQLVMSGQFAGSNFRLAVFAPDCSKVTGYMSVTNRSLLENYDIEFYDFDGRSRQMYTWLTQKKDSLRYIVVAAGNSKTNREISSEIARFIGRAGSSAQVYRCEYSGVTCYTEGTVPPKQQSVYTVDLLCTGGADKMAMLLNHSYCANDKTPQENWAACDYFSRMSSRASADFMPSMLIAAGKTPRQAVENWDISPQMLENLARTEHLRWCAFHYAMGFEKMPPQVYDEREKQYLREKSATGHSNLRTGKDMALRQHACLIPWEELDALSARENAVTGGNVDYKEADRKNIRAVQNLLRALND